MLAPIFCQFIQFFAISFDTFESADTASGVALAAFAANLAVAIHHFQRFVIGRNTTSHNAFHTHLKEGST
jgi:hypothetical protein